MHFFEQNPSGRQREPAPRCAGASDAELVAQIAGGGASGRAAAATFLLRHEALIRRRLRHKLTASLRRLFDSDDLFSTVVRRIDREVEQRRLAILDERQFWALINRIGDNCIVDISRQDQCWRAASRLVATPGRTDGVGAGRAHDHGGESIHRATGGAAEEDRQILFLRVLGAPFSAIGAALGMTEQVARKRWQRLRRLLRQRAAERDGR